MFVVPGLVTGALALLLERRDAVSRDALRLGDWAIVGGADLKPGCRVEIVVTAVAG